jgi:uncharacterized protein (TIGR03000 family)
MYSVVVMMALSTSAETPDCGGGRRGCRGCYGGYSCAGCYGGWCGGGYGGGCYGGRAYYGGGGRFYGSGPYYGGTTYLAGPGYEGSGGVLMPDATGTRRFYYEPGQGTEGQGVTRREGDDSVATVTVRLPSAGPLTIDDYRVPYTTDNHVFVTSPLGADETRKLTFTTQVMKDGKPEAMTKQITVKRGQNREVDFRTPAPPAPKD